MDIIKKLQKVLKRYENQRVIALGTTCTGKSTFVKKIKNAKDMDELIFPLLSKEEEKYVCQNPWTKKIGRTMTHLVKERINVEKGNPLFGTVLLDCDFIIYLEISDTLLKKRCIKRKADFNGAKNMQKMILEEIKKSKIPFINLKID